jgi:NitT/TauT family transport system permease protein
MQLARGGVQTRAIAISLISSPLALKILVLLSAVLLWQTLVYFKVYRFGYLPSVTAVLAAASEYIPSTRFLSDMLWSTYRVAVAWLLALAIGVPLGLMIGWRRAWRELVFPAVELLRPIPPIAWIPASIIFFPQVEASVIFICFIGAFFPIVLNTVTGVFQLDETYFRAARCCGAREYAVFRHVVLRGAMPYIVIGAAVGMGVCWMAVVAAEMIAGERGLGYMIWEAYSLAEYPLIIVGMVVIGAIGATMSWLIRVLEKWLVAWHRT